MGVGGRDHRSRPHPLIEEVASWVQGKAAKSGSHSDCERPTNATSMFTPAEAKGRQVSPRRKVRAQSQCQRRDVRHGMERRCFFACERRAPSSTNESTRRLQFFCPFLEFCFMTRNGSNAESHPREAAPALQRPPNVGRWGAGARLSHNRTSSDGGCAFVHAVVF